MKGRSYNLSLWCLDDRLPKLGRYVTMQLDERAKHGWRLSGRYDRSTDSDLCDSHVRTYYQGGWQLDGE